MASEVSICNNALVQLGAEDLLISLEDNTKAGRLCNAMYEMVRDEVLTSFVWNSALKQAQLAALVETPTYEYSYAFQLPVDCLRVIKIGIPETAANAYLDTDPFGYHHWQPVKWRRFGRKVYSNVSPLHITYVYKVTDPEEMDPMLRDAISARLAWKIAYDLTGSRGKEQDMKQNFAFILEEAMICNSLEGSTDSYNAMALLVVR